MLLQEELGDITREQRKALQTCRRGTVRAFRIIDEALALGSEGETQKMPEPAEAPPRPAKNADVNAPSGEPGK